VPGRIDVNVAVDSGGGLTSALLAGEFSGGQ